MDNFVLVYVSENDVVAFFTDAGDEGAFEKAQNYKALFKEVCVNRSKYSDSPHLFLILQNKLDLVPVTDDEILVSLG